jgi:dynein heavy chain
MAVIEADPHVLNIYNTPTLLADLKLSLEIMEQIQKALEHHLELKRIEFPRFFFLSNDELISTLAEARDPVHVQHHLKKCFEGVDTLIFGAKDTDIIGVRSKDKEEIRFIDKINIKDFRSSIEKWLQRVDDNSKKALARFFDICLTDLNTIQRRTISRKDWVFKHPGQAVICIGSVHWTMSVESLLRNNVGDLP